MVAIGTETTRPQLTGLAASSLHITSCEGPSWAIGLMAILNTKLLRKLLIYQTIEYAVNYRTPFNVEPHTVLAARGLSQDDVPSAVGSVQLWSVQHPTM